MFTQITILSMLGSLFLVVIIGAAFLRSRGQAIGNRKKLPFKQGLIFIFGFLLLMILTVYQKGNNL